MDNIRSMLDEVMLEFVWKTMSFMVFIWVVYSIWNFIFGNTVYKINIGIFSSEKCLNIDDNKGEKTGKPGKKKKLSNKSSKNK